MKVAYVAGAYRDPRGAYYIGRNIEAAREVAVELWRLGFAVICPHTNTAFMDGACADAVWLEGDKEFVRRSDVVVMVPNWTRSSGAQGERELALSVGVPVVVWQWGHGQAEVIRALADLRAPASRGNNPVLADLTRSIGYAEKHRGPC